MSLDRSVSSEPVRHFSPHPVARKLQAAWMSLGVTALLMVAKLAVGLATNSLAILSLAAESGIDLAAVVITLLAVRVSSVPPDEDHPYGHGKFESLSALAQGLLLFGVAVWIAVSAVGNLKGVPQAVDANLWGFGVLIFSAALDFGRAKFLRASSREHHSASLEASSLHFFTDSFSSAVAVVALLLIRFQHWFQADDYAALIVAAFVAYFSVRVVLNAVDGLTDRYITTGDYDRLKAIAERTHGVESVGRMRMRSAGPVVFVEVSVAISRVLPFAAVQRIVAEAERAILAEFPQAEVTVHWRPIRTAAETPFETLKMVATEYGLTPHNMELSKMQGGKPALDYHLEFRPGTSLEEAVMLSSEIEQTLRRELPEIDRFFSHLEEERPDHSAPHVVEIESNKIPEMAQCASEASGAVLGVSGIHLFRDERDASLKLVLTVELHLGRSLKEAHEIVTEVELALRERFPELTRILVQAEVGTPTASTFSPRVQAEK